MSYLYEDIMKVPGLTGSSGDRQTQLYKNLGAPMGNYTGSYNQNVWLWDQIQKGNYGNVAPTVQPTQPAQPATPSVAPAYRESFNKILPFDQIFNDNLVNGLAESQINPEIQRAYGSSSRDLERGLGQSGAYRTGLAGMERENLSNAYARQQKEGVSDFSGNIKNWLTDWYNQQYETYNKNPSAYVTPSTTTFQDVLKTNPTYANIFNSYLK